MVRKLEVGYTHMDPKNYGSSQPGQGELNVDDLMKMKLEALTAMVEPGALEVSHDLGVVALVSIATSLKAIRTTFEGISYDINQTKTGLNSLCTILDRLGNTIKPANDAVVGAIRGVEYELKSSEGRSLNITVAKGD